MNLRYVSWFSGVGGFELGLNSAGMKCVGACELDDFARRVYAARFGVPSWFPTDINDVESADIPDSDLWVGGSPCVGFSIAGKRDGLADTRSGLLRVWMDLLAAKRPRFLLFENVYGIFSANGGSDWGEFIAKLDECDYSGAWVVRDARYFGVPQRRRRVFLIAERGQDQTVACETLFESGQPFSPVLFRHGYEWRTGQRSLFGDAPQTKIDWGSGGRWASGKCETAPWPEAPAEPVPSSLAALLEREAVPSRFFLSPRAASGILRRAERRGRDLPDSLKNALGRVADTAGGDLGADDAPDDPLAFSVKDHGADATSDMSPTLRAGGFPAQGSVPLDGQEVMGAMTATYGSGAELHPERMGRDANQLVMGFRSNTDDGAGKKSGTDRTPMVVEPMTISPRGAGRVEARRDGTVNALTVGTHGSGPHKTFVQADADVPAVANALKSSHGGADDNDARGGRLILDSVGPLLAGGSNRGHRVGADEAAGGHIVIQDARPLDKDQNGIGISSEDVAYTLDTMGVQAVAPLAEPPPEHDDIVRQAVSAKWSKRSSGPSGDEHHNLVLAGTPAGDVASTIRASDGHHGHSSPRGDGSDNLVVDATAEPIAFDAAQITSKQNRTRVEPGLQSPSLAATNRVHVEPTRATAGVRRLVPSECEALQGLPTGHTCTCGVIPYSTATCQCADGPRYRVVGNGVAVPVVEWIARRLVAATSKERA